YISIGPIEEGDMRALCLVAILSILSSTVVAQSLGEVARREQERRDNEKKKQGASATQPKVIGDEDLHSASSKDSKGTYSAPAGSTGTSPSSSATAGRAAASPGGLAPSAGSLSEVDGLRAAARGELEESYQRINAVARTFVEGVQLYESSRCEDAGYSPRCARLLANIATLAFSIGSSMEDAEDAARRGWLPPGEVTATRARYGMSSSYWDRLVELVHRYRK